MPHENTLKQNGSIVLKTPCLLWCVILRPWPCVTCTSAWMLVSHYPCWDFPHQIPSDTKKVLVLYPSINSSHTWSAPGTNYTKSIGLDSLLLHCFTSWVGVKNTCMDLSRLTISSDHVMHQTHCERQLHCQGKTRVLIIKCSVKWQVLEQFTTTAAQWLMAHHAAARDGAVSTWVC